MNLLRPPTLDSIRLSAVPSPIHRARWLASFLVMGLVTTAVPDCLAACPENGGMSGCEYSNWSWSSLEPGAQYWQDTVTPWQAGASCPAACYDLRAGTLVAAVEGSPFYGCREGVGSSDRYEIVGASSGEPYSFTAQVTVAGTMEGVASLTVKLADLAPGGPSQVVALQAGDFPATLTIPLRYAVGETFQVASSLYGVGYVPFGRVSATAILRFAGLPAGTSVVSCQGYDLPVPVLVTTWSRVKASYR